MVALELEMVPLTKRIMGKGKALALASEGVGVTRASTLLILILT